jgi:hypothetical protein
MSGAVAIPGSRPSGTICGVVRLLSVEGLACVPELDVHEFAAGLLQLLDAEAAGTLIEDRNYPGNYSALVGQ